MSPFCQARPTTVERNVFVTLNVMSTREVSPHSATIYPWRTISPLAAPRSFTGPIGVSNGSRAPNVVARSTRRSLVAGFSFAIANWTASSSPAWSIPASDAFRFCQSKRSGK